MTKLSLSDVMIDEGARMLSLGTSQPDVPPHLLAAPQPSESKHTNGVQKLDMEALTGMKIVQPMRIHRYRRG